MAASGRWLISGITSHHVRGAFILTTLDAGTRVGRYLLQDALAPGLETVGETKSLGANIFASLLVVAGWATFSSRLYDPLGASTLFGRSLASPTRCLRPLHSASEQL